MNKPVRSNIIALSDVLDAETEFIPLLSSEDEELMNAEDVPEVLPILPLRNYWRAGTEGCRSGGS
jgi:ATP-dependent Lon protease